jgi:ribonuclease-3
LPKYTGQYAELFETLDYEFQDLDLLREALTHPSLEGVPHYQRLEFVGDRVLGLVISQWLFERHVRIDEGGLAGYHANLVKGKTCAKVAKTMNIAPFILMAKSTEDNGGRDRCSILSDVCESLIGAVYQEAGYDVADALVRRLWAEYIDMKEMSARDGKTLLQEFVQGRGQPIPTYTMTERSGPAHEPLFTIAARVQDEGDEMGQGGSKRDAEQEAAAKMLKKLKSK